MSLKAAPNLEKAWFVVVLMAYRMVSLHKEVHYIDELENQHFCTE